MEILVNESCVMKKSYNMKNWQKVMEFCDQSWNVDVFVLEFYKICAFFADIGKFTISVENLYSPTLSAKCHHCEISTERWS